MGKLENTILVAGDFILDHHIYEGRRHHFADAKSPGVMVCPELGGAALVQRLLWQESAGSSPARPVLLPPGWKSYQTVIEPPVVGQGQQAFAFWRPKPGIKNLKFWRVTEGMGFGSAQGQSTCSHWPTVEKPLTQKKIIVLADGGMGFRNSAQCWEKLPFRTAEWIVYKTEAPHFGGKLWKRLSKHRNKLVVVVSASELRKTNARISTGLSWEATLQDLYRELDNGALRPLAVGCAHLAISFGVEGAIWIDFASTGSGGNRLAHLIFDTPATEGDRSKQWEGTAFGLMSCLTAGIVWSLTSSVDSGMPANLLEGVEGGLSAMRDLLERGHGPAEEDSPPPKGFPANRLAEVIRSPRHLYSRSHFPWNKTIVETRWSLLRQAAPDLASRARMVAVHGDIALQNVPHLIIRNLLTADRQEIECLRTVVQTIERYKTGQMSAKKPLSLGIFGPPGAGKSFAVEEIANQYFGKESWMVFNLSQFKDESDLIGAFHQIRDRALQGIIPVAFFDEFDSQNLRWLQYLLAPMQDGKFQEGQITHPIGKCVLVFAGGTSFTFKTFTPAPDHKTGLETDTEKHFRLSKGPDFSSRLDATLDVLGPNARPLLLSEPPKKFNPKTHIRTGTHFFAEDPDDDYKFIRRARMIRFELGVVAEAHLNIDPGLLEALLKTPRYTHGSRSLAKIAQSLKCGSANAIRPSALPPIAQTEMHTDTVVFLKLMSRPTLSLKVEDLFDPEVEAIAPVIHEIYRALGKQNGWLGPKDDKDFKDFPDFSTPQEMCAPKFDDKAIAAWKKESNREAARRIPLLLSVAGMKLAAVKSTSAKVKLQSQNRIESLLELLARTEHDAWMKWHFDFGWKYGKQRNNELKIHDQLLPYHKLDEENKTKDRSQVRNLTAFANGVGKQIILG